MDDNELGGFLQKAEPEAIRCANQDPIPPPRQKVFNPPTRTLCLMFADCHGISHSPLS